ncbi:MAG: hypothetical protein JXB29_10205 [Sedimentisphaerales bacterium]|nr:hypothetical protein [Sedimentisphaerales bacterium]
MFILLLYKPADSQIDNTGPASRDQQYVSTYLTNELLPGLYNGLQNNEPFDLLITEQGINDIIADCNWPRRSDSTELYLSEVRFTQDAVVLTGTAQLKGVAFHLTILVEPKLDSKGFLQLQVTKFKVGAMNMTMLFRIIAKKRYQQYEINEADKDDWQIKVAASLLNEEPFDPLFDIQDRRVRVRQISMVPDQLTVRLVTIQND